MATAANSHLASFREYAAPEGINAPPREEGCEPDSVARPDRPEGGGGGLQRKDAAAAQKSPNLLSEWKVCFCTMGEESLRNG